MVRIILLFILFIGKFMHSGNDSKRLSDPDIVYESKEQITKKIILNKLKSPELNVYQKMLLIKQNQNLFDKPYKEVFDNIWEWD
jgi:hypothetical protein